MQHILEYLAFGGSLASVWLYGKRGYSGPIAGMITSVLFVAFGLSSEIYAAIASNAIFLIIHLKNMRKAMSEDVNRTKKEISKAGKLLQSICHKASFDAGWWTDIKTGEHLINAPRIVEQKLCLIHSEISEAMEGHRKNLQDDKLPHRKMIEVELADAIIRIADLAGALDLDLGGAIAEKMEFNLNRPDHKIENRIKGGGKAY